MLDMLGLQSVKSIAYEDINVCQSFNCVFQRSGMQNQHCPDMKQAKCATVISIHAIHNNYHDYKMMYIDTCISVISYSRSVKTFQGYGIPLPTQTL